MPESESKHIVLFINKITKDNIKTHMNSARLIKVHAKVAPSRNIL